MKQNPDPAARARKGCPYELLLFILIPVLIVGAIRLALRASRGGSTGDVDQSLVETYVGLVAEGRYDEAYEQCLSSEFRRSMSAEAFSRAHAEAREERGALRAREILMVKPGRNLFSGVREVQILYRLEYENGEWRNYLSASDADGEWRILGLYRRGAGHLVPAVW